MHSQYGIDSSSKIKLKHIVGLLSDALKKEQEKWAWEMWLILWPRMTKETFKSFEDYKKELFRPQIRHTEKTSEQIMNEMMPVISGHEKSKQTY